MWITVYNHTYANTLIKEIKDAVKFFKSSFSILTQILYCTFVFTLLFLPDICQLYTQLYSEEDLISKQENVFYAMMMSLDKH